ncbi:MAG TPA: flavodoxin domain-containing protein [Solirubrobacter sp.]|nr:flavodoxin domain-containing protein [Solirubrobacter sp.]
MSSVLVVYASKHGSTAEIAEAITATLRESGVAADCAEAGDVTSLDGYGAVVLGSAVYMRRWRREARHFLDRHADELAARPLWIFSSGPAGDPAKDNPRWSEPPKVIAKAERLGAREHVVFGGYMPGRAGENLPPAFRDRRDWDEIAAWARTIAAALVPA